NPAQIAHRRRLRSTIPPQATTRAHKEETSDMKKILMTVAVAAAMTTGAAQAQVNVMLPAGPGGGWDTTGRQALQAMNDAGIYTGGVSFTNTGGAGGTIGLAEFISTH